MQRAHIRHRFLHKLYRSKKRSKKGNHNTQKMKKAIVITLLSLLPTATRALSSSTPASVKTTNNRKNNNKILKGIDASQFRHPLDRDLTNFFSKAPLSGIATAAIRRSLSIVEQGVRLDLLSSSVKVSPNQLPELYESMQNAACILDMDVVPELYVQSSPQANAYTLALQGTYITSRIRRC